MLDAVSSYAAGTHTQQITNTILDICKSSDQWHLINTGERQPTYKGEH